MCLSSRLLHLQYPCHEVMSRLGVDGSYPSTRQVPKSLVHVANKAFLVIQDGLKDIQLVTNIFNFNGQFDLLFDALDLVILQALSKDCEAAGHLVALHISVNTRSLWGEFG